MNNSSNGIGLSLLGALTIVFVILKLTKVIVWSWWWVLAPAWIPITLSIGFAIIMLIIGGVIFLSAIKKRK